MPDQDATAQGSQAPPRWLDPLEIVADEGHARVDQEMLLLDVLEAIDQLAATFTPVSGARITLTGQIAALVALESGLFGHLRSVRAATRDGRIQDVEAAIRTLEEIRKKAVLAAADASLAARFAQNEEFKSQALDDMYEKHMRGLGKGRTDEQRERDRELFGRQSWIIHARHAGLQFLASEDEGGPIVTRSPVSMRLPDHGREAALHALAVAAQGAAAAVPPILTAHGISHDAWTARFHAFAEKMDALALPYRARNQLRKEFPNRKVEVDSIGQVMVEGLRVLVVESDLADEDAASATQ